ncbi:MAG: Resolvase protein [Candidatus Saccharibacteria bacterium]|nr:Resolvase protein [Candidatus Saccharibacteria bacterium]
MMATACLKLLMVSVTCVTCSGKSTVEPIDGKAEHVAYLLNEFSKGTYTIKELIEMAHERGLTRLNGKPMDHMFMGKMLRQPLYARLEQSLHTGGELVDSVFDGIISKQTFYRIQQVLENNKNSKTGGYVVNHPDYPLRRFIRCATCGRPIRGGASTGASGKTYPRYHCDKCKKAAVQLDELDDKFAALLEDVTPNELSLKLMKTMIVRVWNDELKTLHNERKSLQAHIDSLEEHKQKATDKVVSDEITKNEKLTIHRKADEQISDLQKAVSKLGKQIGTKQEAIDYALSYMDDAPRLWRDASPDVRVTYQAMVFPKGLDFNFYTKELGTPVLSHLYTLANMKTGTEVPDNSTMVISRRIELRLPG